MPDLPGDICSTLPMSILYRLALEPIAQRPDIHHLHFLPGQSSIQLSQTSGILVGFFAGDLTPTFELRRQQNIHSDYLSCELLFLTRTCNGNTITYYLSFSNVLFLNFLWYRYKQCLSTTRGIFSEEMTEYGTGEIACSIRKWLQITMTTGASTQTMALWPFLCTIIQ